MIPMSLKIIFHNLGTNLIYYTMLILTGYYTRRILTFNPESFKKCLQEYFWPPYLVKALEAKWCPYKPIISPAVLYFFKASYKKHLPKVSNGVLYSLHLGTAYVTYSVFLPCGIYFSLYCTTHYQCI